MREAEGGGDAGVGHGDDDVRIDGRLEGELAAHGFAAVLHGASEDDAVRA